MSFGQKNYNEIQGINGKYRINQIGCFLVSFSNLLERFAQPADPLSLNRIFRDNGIYVDVDDGIRDDLAYSSVTRANGNIVVSGTGTGKPTSNNSIVKFNYKSGNGLFNTHFSLVHDAAAGLIIDSWDGQIKSWNVYGGPVFWASYENRAPAPVTPVPAAPTQNDSIVVQAGWGISHVAKAAGFADWDQESRWNAIAQLNGHANRTTFRLFANQVVKVRGDVPAAPVQAPTKPVEAPQQPEVINITVQAGWGITHVLRAAGYSKEQYENEAEWDRIAALNGSASRLRLKPGQVLKAYKSPIAPVQATPAPVAVPEPVPTVVETPVAVAPVVDPPKEAAKEIQENEDGSVNVPVTVVPKDPKAYQKSLLPEDKVYIAVTSKLIHDMDKLHMDLQLVAGQKITSGGRFWKHDDDGKAREYVITKKYLADGKWYGIPVEYLGAGQDPNAYVGPLLSDEDDQDDYLLNLLDPDFIAESKEALKTWSSREKFVDFLGSIYDKLVSLVTFKFIRNKKEK
jgi:hypothetical protein